MPSTIIKNIILIVVCLTLLLNLFTFGVPFPDLLIIGGMMAVIISHIICHKEQEHIDTEIIEKKKDTNENKA